MSTSPKTEQILTRWKLNQYFYPHTSLQTPPPPKSFDEKIKGFVNDVEISRNTVRGFVDKIIDQTNMLYN